MVVIHTEDHDTHHRKLTLKYRNENHEIIEQGITKSAVYTDGSRLDDKRTGAAISINSSITHYWGAKYKSCNVSAGLEAIDTAIAKTNADIIFTDCLEALITIDRWKEYTKKEKMNNPNRAIIRT